MGQSGGKQNWTIEIFLPLIKNLTYVTVNKIKMQSCSYFIQILLV